MTRRVFITGGARTGKTTLARVLRRGQTRIIHTDDYLSTPHEAVPDVVRSEILASGDDVVVEGTHVARLLRRYPELAKGQYVYYLGTHVAEQTPGQRRQATGIRTVWQQARPALHRAGAIVIQGKRRPTPE
jgi:hypothetical protein